MKISNFKLRIIVTSLTCFILNCIIINDSHSLTSAQTLPKFSTTEAQVTISASLGEPLLKLWGYGAPNSRIELSGDQVSDFAYSRDDGYFEFPKVYLPSPSDSLYPELCLTEVDAMGRATVPTCIPALPATEFTFDVGPVILPPTLSLTDGSVAPNSQSGASGITIPNSDIKIVLAEDSTNQNISKYSIVSVAHAYYLPNYTVKSDSRGYFSFNMPNNQPKDWNVFAITTYSQGATSPKSNTLKFEVVSPTTKLIQSLWAFILSLLSLPILIVFEVAVILLIIAAIILKRKKKKVIHQIAVDPVKEYQEFLKSKTLV